MWIRPVVCCLWLAATAFGQQPTDALYAEVLAQANLTPQEVRFAPHLFDYFFRTQHTTPLFVMLLHDPLRFPYYAERLRSSLVGAIRRPVMAVEMGAGAIGVSIRRTLVGDPLQPLYARANAPNALENAVGEVYKAANTPMSPAVREQLQRAQKTLPEWVLRQAAFLVYVAIEARRWRDAALRDLTPEERNALFKLLKLPVKEFEATLGSTEPNAELLLLERALEKVDLARLLAGGHDSALSIQQVIEAFQKADPPTKESLGKPFEFTIDTPWGRIRLCGGGNDTHPQMPYLVLLDTGGNDAYYGGGATLALENAVSFLIDLAGDDRYGDDTDASGKPLVEREGRGGKSGAAFGGALLGYAMLADLEGDDVYRTQSMGLGAARFGVAMLLDLQGDDLYDAYACAQGAAMAGVGVLVDGAGRDRYTSFYESQGYGGVKGFGALLDALGDDAYTAHPTPVEFPSPQTAERNVSMAQGAGYGRRADYLDGRSWAGGIGMLVDVQGNDRYTCGVFGQGVGYWGGVGMLIDLQGDDVREGVWYVQGASAHFAIGYLEDRLGNDRYLAAMNMAMGAGHDFAIGYLMEFEGNDEYNAPNLALGGANANGIGVFVDLAGDDLYQVRGNEANLGRANPIGKGTLRERGFALGLFLDAAGNDSYPPNVAFAGNARNWIIWAVQNERPNESQLGLGMDK
ncbi:MAG: hypothetical protein CFK49_00940 [Armatimonadetes bacterium JP3_11]|jgi:hypothetical protein|nr:MAG: hypothetical protein CFK48_08265 [Armatimonadetes bacterium CP1_7O]OYT75904.1 MAG: hypothetical protein CFK49_00940 [Armatimonadetes bacterium JP3_11]RMH07366.1 MAG: hypothetical protein D6697_08830 [Armatimonadota bacterium]